MGFERARTTTAEAVLAMANPYRTRCADGAGTAGDAPDIAGGKVQLLPTEGTISALNIPHSSIVSTYTKSPKSRPSCWAAMGSTEKIKHANRQQLPSAWKSLCVSTSASERKDARPDLLNEHAPRNGRRGETFLSAAANRRRSHRGVAGDPCAAFFADDEDRRLPQGGPVSVRQSSSGRGD